MSAAALLLPALREALDATGLLLFGGFDLKPGDLEPGELSPAQGLPPPRALLLVGNAGSAIWPAYQAARSRRSQSLDDWTRSTIDPIARRFGLDARYPFQAGAPLPFTRWALRTGRLFASPLGLTIHPTFGLWHAFRAALLLPEVLEGALEPGGGPRSPCESCAARPCLRTCPVHAFGAEGYDFQTCLGHLTGTANACRARGCLARAACPVGAAFAYRPAHAAFHMEALIRAHRPPEPGPDGA